MRVVLVLLFAVASLGTYLPPVKDCFHDRQVKPYESCLQKYGKTDCCKRPGYSRFKVSVVGANLAMADNYCKARGGNLGAPQDDYEYVQVLQLFQGRSGWINVYRENNTLFSTSSDSLRLSYIPAATGPDGNLTIDSLGDLVPRASSDSISFLCRFDVTEEEQENIPTCPQESLRTEKGNFRWVEAYINSTVKIICPHGTVGEVEGNQRYATRSCLPGDARPAWGAVDMTRCKYANSKTQELDFLKQVAVTSDNAVQIAGQVLTLTNDSEELDGTGVALVTDIIEDLVGVKDKAATADITHTLSNLLDVDTEVLIKSQETARTADRIVQSLETVAGNVATGTEQNTLVTKNIEITAVKVSNTRNTSLVGSNGVDFELPPSAVKGEASVYLITYSSDKLFSSRIPREEDALSRHQNKSLPSEAFVNTPIISAGVEGHDISGLKVPLKVVLPTINQNAGPGGVKCVFYDNSGEGQWLSDGLQTIYEKVGNETGKVTCLSSHMTSFAVIMTIEPETKPVLGHHVVILDTISYICLFFSLTGLILTIMALSLQRSLWRLDMTKIHVYLSISLFVGYVLFVIGIDQTESRVLCITSAFLMHVAFLTSFMWMGVEAYTLYLQFVKVFPSYTPNFIPKCMIVVFIVPLAIAGGFLVAALTTDTATFYELDDYCWLKSYSLYYGFILPILLIVACNLVLFGFVTRNICRIMPANTEDNPLGKFTVQLRAALSVLVVLGVTWILGAFTFGTISLVFQYGFTILCGLQGFSIFLFHVLLKPEVRKKWYNTVHDITNSFSSNSQVMKSNSYHKAQKYEVQNLRDEDCRIKSNNTSLTSANSDKPMMMYDKRFTYLSNSNDYATIESRPSSVSSGMSDQAPGLTAPLIKHHPSSPPELPPLRDSMASLVIDKRPTVASQEHNPTPGDPLTPGDRFDFSPISHPRAWEYNPLRSEYPDSSRISDLDFLRENEDKV